jgi:hypothetical protein
VDFSQLKTEGKFIPGSHKAVTSKENAISPGSKKRVAWADKERSRGRHILPHS